MTNDSSTGGYLSPGLTPAPLEDAALVAFLQAILVGLTGIAGTLIFPRWQQTPPNQPAIGTNWIAFGITNRKADTFAYEIHAPDANSGEGNDYLARNEELEILCSFYGANADSNAALVRDGLQVGQNREALLLAGMALIGCGDTLSMPALMNNQWAYRVDMSIGIRRAIVRTYPILNLLSAAGTVKEDSGVTSNFNAHQQEIIYASRAFNIEPDKRTG